MWMTDFFREVKNQLRDVYKLVPTRIRDGEPCFDSVPDGIYPMTIEGELCYCCFISNQYYLLGMKSPPKVT